MNEEIKTEETRTDFKKYEIGSLFSILIFLLSLLVINVVWLFSSQKNDCLTLLIITSILSLLLGFSLIFQNRKFANKLQKEKLEMEDFCQRRITEENEDMKKYTQKLEEANKKLQKINQEFMETTKKLFEREMELTQANKKLKEIDKTKTDFVSVAAHQLRTPLTGIKWSYLTLLEKETGPLNQTQKEIVEKGIETIDYTISIINDLLNTARLEEGRAEFNFTVQPIGPIIKEVIDQHQPTIKEKEIEVEIDVPLFSSFSFKFDKEKIAVVFDNILANAVKYTPSKGKISIKSFRREKDIQFKISDTGIGIPKEDIDRVFSKFFRSKNAVSFETSGSGLGLYVAKNIIERHGGTITLESKEGKGTTFIITLPIQ